MKFQTIEIKVAESLTTLTQAPAERTNAGARYVVPKTTIPVLIPQPITLIIKNCKNSLRLIPTPLLNVQNLFQ